ncbi:hypothetical protein DCC81_21940 [Chitinophaga parva]|uniref:DUF4175 domain-containing protein n=1 Tax=Chitinophaga parva TaxID=2169414 RepID=A0A2T7BD95_9BACT|nr:hypothetical protein DCC81_21940 [Chitinophaga parva]
MLVNALRGLALGLILCGLLQVSRQWSVCWLLPLWILSTLAFYFIFPYRRITAKDVTTWIDQHCPEMEDSSALLLEPAPAGLAALQADKVGNVLEGLHVPAPLGHALRSALLLAGGSLLVLVMMWYVSSRQVPAGANHTAAAGAPAPRPAGIAAVQVMVEAPAYTRQGKTTQADFDLKVPAGSHVQWMLRTDKPTAQLALRFNDSLEVPLQTKDSVHWQLERVVQLPGFYQVKLHGVLSALYKLEVIRDQPPQVEITAPAAYTLIDYGQPPQVQLQARLEDDYGLQKATLFVTVASGSGEAVKFRDLQFPLPLQPGARQAGATKLLSLRAFNMQPGDELYCYISAADALHQEARSERAMIVWQDTAQLMKLEGMTNGVDLKPAFFRSERQIIIETEQLLRDKDTISLQHFQEKSSDLGMDQKLLRLRYGQFLGEEAEEGTEHREALDALNNPADFSNAAKILDLVTDKHDNAEDATFFDPKTKAQLKATLTEMWNAELRLRTYDPAGALPFAYKALRMLKDLQQQSRAYVAKTGAKLAPLKPEKRLTGELGKIAGPLTERDIRNLNPDTLYRISLGLLEQWRDGQAPDGHQQQLLQRAGIQLATQAVRDPGGYLPAVAALRRMLATGPSAMDLQVAERALQQLVPVPPFQPYRRPQVVDMNLSKTYFEQLKEGKNK